MEICFIDTIKKYALILASEKKTPKNYKVLNFQDTV